MYCQNFFFYFFFKFLNYFDVLMLSYNQVLSGLTDGANLVCGPASTRGPDTI
jgi:hypothetical protein